MHKLRLNIIVLLILTLFCIQCDFSNSKDPNIEIKRFEVDFYQTDTNDFRNDLIELSASYPSFYPVFVEDVLAITNDYSNFTEIDNFSSYVNQLRIFRTHPSMLGLMDTIQAYYPDLKSIEADFEKALGRYYRFFPKADSLEVVTFVSEFGNKAILYEGGIGISLDMFLGKQYPFYSGMQLPDYIIEHLNRDQILPNAMRVLSEDFITNLPTDATLLDNIILEGKRLYFAQQMLPKTPSHSIIEYTKEQYDWCIENEFNIWSFLVEGNHLYNSKFTQYRRYIEDSPTTMGMPPDAPGKIGIFIGWQIVNKFMQNNRGVSLAELMQLEDAQEILKQSKYKPAP